MDNVFDRNQSRLSDDHANASLIAERLATSQGIRLDLTTAQTNILLFHFLENAPDAPAVVVRACERGLPTGNDF